MIKSKDKFIIIFYVLYFSWLFTVTYLTRDPRVLNYFTIGVTLFYFAFLSESLDILWFLGASFIPLILALLNPGDSSTMFNLSSPLETPIWLPLAWGTTILALRKFYLKISK